MKTFLVQHWPTLVLAVALGGVLLAAQIAIFNTPPLPAADLESRAAALQAARAEQ
ncbi:MAG: hypothetical protein ACYC0P_03065 [Thiobacillus sp.]